MDFPLSVVDFQNQPSQNSLNGAWSYCSKCGKKIAFLAINCPKCGAPTNNNSTQFEQKSSKSYAIAISLCGIFGMMGLHHFYIGKYLHGLFDLSLFIGWVSIFILSEMGSIESNLIFLGISLFIIDIIHTIFIFYKLIVGEQRDGKNLLITP